MGGVMVLTGLGKVSTDKVAMQPFWLSMMQTPCVHRPGAVCDVVSEPARGIHELVCPEQASVVSGSGKTTARPSP
jgi:hypothetical protein